MKGLLQEEALFGVNLETYTTMEKMIVKINGYPFYMPAGTVLSSHPDNIRKAFKEPRPDGRVTG